MKINTKEKSCNFQCRNLYNVVDNVHDFMFAGPSVIFWNSTHEHWSIQCVHRWEHLACSATFSFESFCRRSSRRITAWVWRGRPKFEVSCRRQCIVNLTERMKSSGCMCWRGREKCREGEQHLSFNSHCCDI